MSSISAVQCANGAPTPFPLHRSKLVLQSYKLVSSISAVSFHYVMPLLVEFRDRRGVPQAFFHAQNLRLCILVFGLLLQRAFEILQGLQVVS